MATERKTWQPNDKQKMFIETLKVMGSAPFRVIKDYIFNNYGETIATGSINVLTTKGMVSSREEEFDIETTTTYHYPNGDLVETKASKKKEKVYFLSNEEPKETKKASKTEKVVEEEEIDDLELVDTTE